MRGAWLLEISRGSVAKIEMIGGLIVDHPKYYIRTAGVGPDLERHRFTDIHLLRTHDKVNLLLDGSCARYVGWYPNPGREEVLDVRPSGRRLSRSG